MIDLNPEKATNVITKELKKLLQSKSVQSKICACVLIKNLNLFKDMDEKSFSKLNENGFIQLLVQSLKIKKVQLQFEICSVFPPLIPLMIKNGMKSSIDLISSKMINIFKKDLENDLLDRTFPFLTQIISHCNKLQYPLKSNPYEIISIILDYLDEDDSLISDLQPMVSALFCETFDCDASNIHVEKLINFIFDLIDDTRLHFPIIICLKNIFRCLRLNSRPWFQSGFEFCIQFFTLKDCSAVSIEQCLLLSLEIIQIFTKEVESFIGSSKFIDSMIHLIKVEFN
jgi:hypothetical protein